MSPMLTMWLLTGVGAVIFFAVGYLARAQKKAGAGELDDEQATASVQLAGLQDELQRERAMGAAAGVENSRLQEILEQTRQSEAELKSQLEGQGRAAGQLLAERSDLHEKLGEKTREAQSSMDQFAQLKQELDQLRNVRTPGAENQQELGLERKLRADAEERAAVITADLEAAHATVEEITRELSAERQMRTRREEEREAALAEAEQHRSQKQEAEDRLKRLLDAAASRDKLKVELDRLQQENNSLQAQQEELGGAAQELMAANTARDELQQKAGELAEEVTALRRDVEQRQRELESMEEELVKARAEAASRAEALEAATAELERARAELEELRIKVELLEGRTVELESLRSESVELRQRHQEARDASEELSGVRAELKEARIKVELSEGRVSELEELREENRRLREDAADIEELRLQRAELQKLQADHKQLKLEAEVMARRLEGQDQVSSESMELRRRVEELSQQAGQAEQLQQQVQELEAQLFAEGRQPKETRPHQVIQERGEGSLTADIEGALSSLLEFEQVRTVVVADSMGLPVAGVGGKAHQEGLAAFSGQAEELALKSRDILPMSSIRKVMLQDKNELIFSCRLFSCGPELLTLSFLCAEPPPDEERVKKAVAIVEETLGR